MFDSGVGSGVGSGSLAGVTTGSGVGSGVGSGALVGSGVGSLVGLGGRLCGRLRRGPRLRLLGALWRRLRRVVSRGSGSRRGAGGRVSRAIGRRFGRGLGGARRFGDRPLQGRVRRRRAVRGFGVRGDTRSCRNEADRVEADGSTQRGALARAVGQLHGRRRREPEGAQIDPLAPVRGLVERPFHPTVGRLDAVDRSLRRRVGGRDLDHHAVVTRRGQGGAPGGDALGLACARRHPEAVPQVAAVGLLPAAGPRDELRGEVVDHDGHRGRLRLCGRGRSGGSGLERVGRWSSGCRWWSSGSVRSRHRDLLDAQAHRRS